MGITMNTIICWLLFLGIAGTSHANDINEAQRREAVSYSTNVLHGDPNYPDQQAQSSIDFKLETADSTPTLQPARKGVMFTKSAPDSHELSWLANFNSQKEQGRALHTPVYQQNKGLRSNPYTQQMQSFNVGYSVKFGNEKKNFKAPRLESDVITGSIKEEVRKPDGSLIAEGTGYSHLFDAKKQKLTGIKAHYQPYSNVAPTTNHILLQSHVTPRTQQQLAYLETIQGMNKFQKEIDQNVQSSLQSAANSPWQTLSPSVEIYRSPQLNLQNAKQPNFDHQRALGKSEGFDYSNAIDYSGLQFNKPTQRQQGFQNSFFNTQSQFLNSFAQRENPAPAVAKEIPKLPMDTSLLRDPILTAQKQPIASDSQQIPIHFDTSLLQEIGKQYSSIANDDVKTTIATFPTQAVANSFKIEVNEPNPTKPGDSSALTYQKMLSDQYMSEQASNEPRGIFQQQHLPKQAQEIKFGYPQNGLFNPSVQKMPPTPPHKYYIKKNLPLRPVNKQTTYSVNEHVDEKLPQQTQFKVFGKPPNGFMRHEYEKRQKKNGAPRQPRINPKRTIRDYSIETDLKPPPMTYSLRPRRMFTLSKS